MTIDLQTCIHHHSLLLGSSYQNLGNSSPNHSIFHKVFLSFNAKTGWYVKTLNPLQLLLRKCFGFYKDTHLQLVHTEWWASKERGYRNPALDRRMQEIWCKSYLLSLQYKNGTTDVRTPQVHCFGEFHEVDQAKIEQEIIENFNLPKLSPARIIESPTKKTDFTFRKTMAEYIEAHYKEGDIILVESFEENEDGRSSDMVRFLKGNYLVQGWECKEFQDHSKKDNAQFYKLLESIGAINKLMPGDNNYSLESLIPLRQEMHRFLDSLPSFIEYYHIKDQDLIPLATQSINKLLHILTHKSLHNATFKDPLGVCKLLFLRFTRKLYDLQEKQMTMARYLNDPNVHSKSLNTAADEQLKYRNISFCRQIDRHVAAGRNVFAITGLCHILPEYDVHPDTLSETKATLKKHSAKIMIPRKRPSLDEIKPSSENKLQNYIKSN